MNLPAIYEPGRHVPQIVAERGAAWHAAEDQITVHLLLAMLRRRREVLLLTLAICVVLALVWTAALPRIYRSSADVVMITTSTEVVPGDADQAQSEPTRSEDVETQIQLIRSREMAGQVLDRTGLLGDEAFRADVIAPRSALDNISSLLGIRRRKGTPQEPGLARPFHEMAVTYLIDRLGVARVDNSYNLRIAFEDYDPERTALVTNTYARLFTTDDARERARTNATAAKVLQTRVDELRRAANRAFAEVQSYRVHTGLLSSAATSLTEQEISTYNQQIAAAQAEAARDAATLASARGQLRSGGADNVGEGGASPVVSALRAQRAQLVIRERDLSQRYYDDNPDLITVRSQIADIDRQIAGEVNRSIKGLEARAQASARRLSSLLASRSGTRAQLSTDNAALVTLADLEKRAEAARTLYQSYLERYNAVVAGSGSEQPGARLISRANVPVLPKSPDLLLNLALGCVVGGLLGATLAIVLELSYRGLTTLDDVESRLGIRGLGFVPACHTVEPHSASPLDTVRDHPDGGFSEALRNVIVSIRHGASGGGKVIAITSAVPGEGKTTIAACMARALAMANERVVVIDCDVIRRCLSRQFGLSGGEPGLHEALSLEAGRVVAHEEPDSALQVIPITRPFARGERLTERGRLHRVIARLGEEFDVIILDCPPILPIAESREIVSLADNVVLVVQWRKTVDKVVKAAVRQLPMRTIKALGIVLNRVDMKQQARFGGHDAASFYDKYRGYYA
ncbi:GumC family protein [Novosphingobium mangrovi (ex Huang et al. 2023)]|uniref:non-specific protein-tyrosine kinase n=1 Tax=Novosphingobium mangrovi (ex Huang et al. 2023) TaxID=2976432 RepID=A0ABT2I1N2_9SPHN|nr:AAA family ATPase [Novosphingobium mangrovi (ex Huang et al. 2023)]MCT2398717.1 AAA family ATPase [Novosphingobium mangrovi (ex Huang et al. 2023)]